MPLHVATQLMPPPATVPLPPFETVRAYVLIANVAVTLLSPFIVIEQVPVPEHAPLQPTKW